MRKKSAEEDNVTLQAILSTAQVFTQERGFSAFSYKDVAEAVGIKTSSIHYYFPQKNDLALALVNQYRKQLDALLGDIQARDISFAKKLKATAKVFINISDNDQKLCLCGMMASDFYGVSDDVQLALSNFFQNAEAAIAGLLEKGARAGEFKLQTSPREEAQNTFALVEGAMLLSRARKEKNYFKNLVNRVFNAYIIK